MPEESVYGVPLTLSSWQVVVLILLHNQFILITMPSKQEEDTEGVGY